MIEACFQSTSSWETCVFPQVALPFSHINLATPIPCGTDSPGTTSGLFSQVMSHVSRIFCSFLQISIYVTYSDLSSSSLWYIPILRRPSFGLKRIKNVSGHFWQWFLPSMCVVYLSVCVIQLGTEWYKRTTTTFNTQWVFIVLFILYALFRLLLIAL